MSGNDETTETGSLSPRTETILKIGLLVIPPILFFGLVEGISFVWERSQSQSIYAWELVASRRIDLVPIETTTGSYTLVEPDNRYVWGGIPVEINDYGFRGPDFAIEKPDHVYRVLNLGDSIAMGWAVGYEDTYGFLLQEHWNESRSENLTYEVINAGVPGWNPENYLAYLATEGPRLDPDLVILELTIVNDVFGPNALARTNNPPVIEWLRSNTYFWPFFSIQMNWLEARAAGSDRIAVIDPPTRASSYYPLDAGHPRWTELWDRVEQIETTAEGLGADFLLVLFPLEFQLTDPDFGTFPQDLLLGRASAAGMPVVDLLPSYLEACQAKPGGPCELEDRYLFADVWMHPSALGHQLAMEAIAAALPTGGPGQAP